ncbi:urease subunit beta [Neisseria wadsworthii 9715]|uniref:Urease subunit beta n=1 Tax=Neisseria wadsworthii 9715 TaxID=1030841 RepID=G4CR14_9NEIS|nr:urease subunit beta [Neisseria wadsworthii 9715]
MILYIYIVSTCSCKACLKKQISDRPIPYQLIVNKLIFYHISVMLGIDLSIPSLTETRDTSGQARV